MSDYQQQAERETWDAIAAAERPPTAGYRRLEARYPGACDSCGAAIAKGQTILYNRRHELRLLCVDCGARADAGENLEHNGPPRPTHRERLEARADKRRTWAEARQRDGDAAREQVHAIQDRIPFGQPILVGHHSERGARADQRRMENGRRRAVENWSKATHHNSKAQGIEEQLRRSIFDDDSDAIEKLRAKLERLEARRDRIKAYNAAVRKAGVGQAEAEHLQNELLNERERADIRGLARIHRLGAGNGFPPYVLTNLGATIRTTRQRLERLEPATRQRLEPAALTAKPDQRALFD